MSLITPAQVGSHSCVCDLRILPQNGVIDGHMLFVDLFEIVGLRISLDGCQACSRDGGSTQMAHHFHEITVAGCASHLQVKLKIGARRAPVDCPISCRLCPE